MNLLKIYHDVDRVLNRIDFHALFLGFHKYKYAVYNSAVICLDGKMMPYQDIFRGNTSIEYNGEYIAIWNMEFDPVDDIEELAYSLVHEMFHCHQRANGEKRYPSDLTLLNYPDDLDNFEKKYNENLYLAQAYEKHDVEALQKFACIRNMRMQAYPQMVREELKAETLEGMAEFIGLKALQVINNQKFFDVTSTYMLKLREQSELLFDVRRLSYYSGAIYYLCCDQNGMNIQNDFVSEQTAYEQNPIAFNEITAEIRYFAFIPLRHNELISKKEKQIAEILEHSEYIACNAFICGYDPMNMFRLKDLICCKYFICLNNNGVVQNIHSRVVLKLAEHSNYNVIGYYIEK